MIGRSNPHDFDAQLAAQRAQIAQHGAALDAMHEAHCSHLKDSLAMQEDLLGKIHKLSAQAVESDMRAAELCAEMSDLRRRAFKAEGEILARDAAAVKALDGAKSTLAKIDGFPWIRLGRFLRLMPLLLAGVLSAQNTQRIGVMDGANLVQPGDNTNRAVRVNCVTGCTGGGGAGGDVNLTGINGTAPGVANPLRIDPTGTTTQPVSATSLPLPSGASTSAKQDALAALIGEVQASPTTNTVLDRLKAVTTALADLLTELQQKTEPANTQTIAGTVTANAGTNLNTSALALESGGNLATVAGAVRAEDAASADGHTGIGALAVRKATPANTSGTDGDYEFLQMSAGRLWTSSTIDAALPAGTNAIGKLATNSGVNIGTVDVATVPSNQTVDVARVNGSTTQIASNGLNTTGAGLQAHAIVGQLDDTSANTCTENQFCNVRISAKGVLYGQIRDAAGNERGVNVDSANALLANPGTAANWGVGATASAPPANANYIAGIVSGATAGLLGGVTVCDQWVDINTTANAQLITGVSGRKVYFCSGNIQMNGGANTVALVSGTGSTCATGTTTIPGFQGSTTAANGYSFAANSGMTWGGSIAPFARSTNNADNICILVGSATRVSGGLAYAIY